jgi:hypothetical protein
MVNMFILVSLKCVANSVDTRYLARISGGGLHSSASKTPILRKPDPSAELAPIVKLPDPHIFAELQLFTIERSYVLRIVFIAGDFERHQYHENALNSNGPSCSLHYLQNERLST